MILNIVSLVVAVAGLLLLLALRNQVSYLIQRIIQAEIRLCKLESGGEEEEE